MRKEAYYKKGMKDGLAPFKEELDFNGQKIDDLDKKMDDVIDLIKWNNQYKNPEKLAKLLKEKRSKEIKKYRISIIYSGTSDQSLADALRKDLNNLNHSCELLRYQEFKRTGGSLADYRVYIGNLENRKERNCKTLYQAYGIKILASNCELILTYNPNISFSDTGKENFISYCETIENEALEMSDSAQNALKDRKYRKRNNPDPMNTKVSDKMADGIWKYMDSMEDKPDWMAIPGIILGGIGLLASIPVVAGELLVKGVVDEMQEKDFDNKFIADAQRRILEVKMIELFPQMQIKKMF